MWQSTYAEVPAKLLKQFCERIRRYLVLYILWSLVRVTEQSLIAREYAEGFPHKSNEVDFVQGKRHYLVSRFFHGLIRNSQVRVSIAYSNRHTPRFLQNCRNNFAKGYGVISFSSALWRGKRVEKNVARPELTKRATKEKRVSGCYLNKPSTKSTTIERIFA